MTGSGLLTSPSGKWMIADAEFAMAFGAVDKMRADGTYSPTRPFRERLSAMVGALLGVLTPAMGWTKDEAIDQLDEEFVALCRVALRAFESRMQEPSSS